MKRGITSLLAIAVFISFTSPQVIAKKKSADSVEAGSVSIKVNADGHSGTVTASDCERCPLLLTFDAQTKFMTGGNPILPAKTSTHSGKSGTVIFDAEQARSLKVIW